MFDEIDAWLDETFDEPYKDDEFDIFPDLDIDDEPTVEDELWNEPGNFYNDDDLTGMKEDDVPVIDTDWVSSRFMVPDSELNPTDAKNRYFTSASLKFTDTSLGGNIGINPRPQYTRYADIRVSGRMIRDKVSVSNSINNPGINGNVGMGRYYSEAIDDNAQVVFMEFGIPRFNNIIDFFFSAIDYEDSVIANTGRSSIGYKIGKFLGDLVMLAAFPLITLTVWGIKAVSKLVFGHGSFDYYYFESAMHLYWSSVSTILTYMATELGILAPEFMPDATKANRMGFNVKINQEDLKELQELWPGIISDNNYIDIFRIASKAQAMANRQMLKERELFLDGTLSEDDFIGYVWDKTSVKESKSPGAGFMAGVNSALSFQTWVQKLVGPGGYFGDKGDEKPTPKKSEATDATKPKDQKPFSANPDGSYNYKPDKKKESKLELYADALDSAVRDGGMHAVFYVDYSGSVSESFSNSTSPIDTGDKLKSVAKKARDIKFDLGGGSLGETVDKAVGYAKDVLAGVLDSVTFGLSSVISTITGNAFVDIPLKYDDSSMSLPKITYKIALRSPYGNVISQLQNIYIPLAMLLAGALPRSVGNSAYTSPFLCTLFSKGVQDIKLGMITDLSITRGVTNLGFNKQRRALGIDVTFTVTDFSTLVTAPVNGSVFDIFNVSINDNTPLARYLATLASRELLTNKYLSRRAKLRYSRFWMKKDQMISPSYWGLRTGETLSKVIGGLASDHSLTLQYQN